MGRSVESVRAVDGVDDATVVEETGSGRAEVAGVDEELPSVVGLGESVVKVGESVVWVGESVESVVWVGESVGEFVVTSVVAVEGAVVEGPVVLCSSEHKTQN